jgi:predicted hydrocarbon binding protein/KaiC/GvpD/RAD55 family RecA-like ATPase
VFAEAWTGDDIQGRRTAMSLAKIQEVPRNTLILLTGPPGAGKSTFCHQVVLNSLAVNQPVIFVTTEQTPADIIRLLRERGLGEAAPGLVSFVDAFTQTVGLTCAQRADTLCANCLDLNSISIAITRLQERMGQREMLLAFDSLTSPYLFSGAEVIRFMRLFLSRFAAEGNSVVALIDEGCGKEQDLVAMMSVADGIITMEIEDSSRIVTVVKHPQVEPTRIESPMTWSRQIACDHFHRKLHGRILEAVFSGRGEPLRPGVGDFINLFWRNLASWSGMLWDPKRFPTMAYELDKQMEFEILREGLTRRAPWRTRLLLKLLMPGSLAEVEDMKKVLLRQGKGMQDRGMRITEYMEDASRKDEHHLKVYEGYNCWGLDNVGARLAFNDCGLMAGAFKALEKEERDWNVVETKCIGLGDPYCEFKIVPGEIAEMRGFLQGIDSSVVEAVHDRLIDQLVGFVVHGRPLLERPRLGSGLVFYIMYHVVTVPALLSERYRMAIRMGGAKAGKEVGEHLVEAGLEEDEATRRVIDFMQYCKVGKITLGETIRIRENCESFALETGEPSCYFTTGFLNGFFSAVKSQHVRETKCIAIGDPYCEWEII